MRVLIVGDLHGNFYEPLRLKESGADLMLQVGDFGCQPKHQAIAKQLHKLVGANGLPFPVHFCDGNHEDHNALKSLRHGCKEKTPLAELPDIPPGSYRVAPGVFWQSRGSTMTLPDGRVVLFAGGAWSVDWSVRRDGVSWFKEEELRNRQGRYFFSAPDPRAICSSEWIIQASRERSICWGSRALNSASVEARGSRART